MTAKILLYGQRTFNTDLVNFVKEKRTEIDPSSYEKIINYKPSYVNKDDKHLAYDPLVVIGKMVNTTSPIDRTGYIETPYNMSYISMPSYNKDFNKSYDNVALERAESIWKKDDNVDVLFSGGIDSTAACAALVETRPSNKKLRIICSESTKIECPDYHDIKNFKEFIVDQTNEEIFNVKNLTPNNTIVTGEPGTFNHVGGVRLDTIKDKTIDKMYNTVGENIDNTPWMYFWKWQEKFIPNDSFKSYEFDTIQKSKFTGFMKNHFKQSPFPIKTLNDMRWWLMFSFRTNWASYAVPAIIIVKAIDRPTRIDLSKWTGFFNNNDWQLWNIKKHVEKTQDALPYKEDSKKFIKRFVNLQDFITNKQKGVSLDHIGRELHTWSRHRCMILDDGRIIDTRKLTSDIVNEIMNG